MDALLQIGKDLARLDGRVTSLEANGHPGCRSKATGYPESALPKEQKAMIAEVRSKHKDIVAGFNDVLKRLKLSDRVKLDGYQLVDIGLARDDEDMCCMCCNLDGQSGWQYCCDYTECSTCC
jgi:hypothetical protein